MAKFKIRSSLVSVLRAKNVIRKETGTMLVRIPYKEKRITGERRFELEIGPDDVVETDNEFSIKVLANIFAPRIRQGIGWFISDPTVSWLEQVDKASVTTIVLTDTDEVLTSRNMALVERYAHELGIVLPRPMLKIETDTLVLAAKAHFAQQGQKL